MVIHEMTADECRAELQKLHLGRLACVRGNQPYIVPVYFGCDGESLFGVAMSGQKVEWMRSNAHVCLEADVQSTHNHWTSIVVFGRYEELSDAPEHAGPRSLAIEILQKRTMWWEPACVPTERQERRAPIFYRIRIDRLTGRRAVSGLPK